MELIIKAAKVAEQRIERAIRREFGVTYPQYRFLHALDTNPSANMGELADIIGCSRGNFTGIADRLERDGWIERGRSKDDRRVITLKMTDAGRRRIAAVKQMVTALNGSMPDAVTSYLMSLLLTPEGGGASGTAVSAG